ncbi:MULTISPECIES: hypothetical protein [unclassified Mesorhizobium]|uniref:hypothetical protein n=1 Tax=unclassified Mesorhizobium TaxID=325217 RepID=UPI0024788629|nr:MULTISPECIES: hypothetical protein [unclassified Mesorhizobium]
MGEALAHRRLAEPDTGRRPAHAPFTEQGVEGDKQVQIDGSQIHAGPPKLHYREEYSNVQYRLDD